MMKFNSTRAVRETTVFEYEPLLEALRTKHIEEQGGDPKPGILSDKTVADMCRVSERQVRKARLEGLDPYMADHFAVMGLGFHPKDIWGDAWVTAESLYVGDIQQGELSELPVDSTVNPFSHGRKLSGVSEEEWVQWQEYCDKEKAAVERARTARAQKRDRVDS